MGHALVGHYLPHTDPVHKISIVSRGAALGFTISLPAEDKFLTTMGELNDTLAMTLGGRAAEEIVFGEITTGAANDLEKATDTAKQMIMRWGMSEKLGPRTLGHNQAMPFLGRDFSQEPDYSEEIARAIDDEIRRIIAEAHERARAVLAAHREQLDSTAKILIERETLERGEFEALLAGTPEEEVFREKDEKARQRSAGEGAAREARADAAAAAGGAARAGQSAQSRNDLSSRRERPAGAMDKAKIEQAVLLYLEGIGEDPTRPGLRDTPRRVADMWDDIFFGLEADPRELLVPMETTITTRWCWCATSPSTRSASIICCPSWARPTSPTSRARAATSPASPSWPAWCAPSPPGPSSRSASRVSSPTPSSTPCIPWAPSS